MARPVSLKAKLALILEVFACLLLLAGDAAHWDPRLFSATCSRMMLAFGIGGLIGGLQPGRSWVVRQNNWVKWTALGFTLAALASGAEVWESYEPGFHNLGQIAGMCAWMGMICGAVFRFQPGATDGASDVLPLTAERRPCAQDTSSEVPGQPAMDNAVESVPGPSDTNAKQERVEQARG